MKLLNSVLLVVFVSVIASKVQDVSGDEVTSEATAPPPTRLQIGIPGLIKRIVTLPIKLVRNLVNFQINAVLKVPFSIISNILKAVLQLLTKIGNIDAEVISKIIGLVKQIIAEVVDVLVNIGVFQGKSVEDVISSITNIVMDVLKFALSLEMQISSSIVNTVENIIEQLNIKAIINNFTHLPVVKEISALIQNWINFIKDNFQTQIDDVMNLIKSQFEKHKDFFQPIFDAISSKILIVSNALHALVNGDLSECPGETSPDKSPTGSLQWQLNIWIDQVKLKVLKLLGLTGWANTVEKKLDELATTVVSPFEELTTTDIPPFGDGGPTTLPPVLSTLTESTLTQSPTSELITFPLTTTTTERSDATTIATEYTITATTTEPPEDPSTIQESVTATTEKSEASTDSATESN